MKATPLPAATDEQSFGGKAASLARALNAGLPVPPGFAISWDLVAKIAVDGASADGALPLFHELGGAVSVRSSAIGEDSAEASFAGQHLTVLNVTNEQQFLDAVRAVHASADTPAAREYRARMGAGGEPRIGVVVQKMIDAETAGVLFTRNPLTGANECVVEASWGLGEAVVSGAVTPDRFRIARSGDVLERTAGVKDIEIRFSASGTEEREVAPDRVRKLCLSDDDLAALRDLAETCKRAFDGELDLEWAFEDGKLYLLQSRPVTRINVAPPGMARRDNDSQAVRAAVIPSVSEESGGWTARRSTDRVMTEVSSGSLSARRLLGFAFAAVLSPLNSTMIAVALPAIGKTFHTTGATLTLSLVTSYLLVSILSQSPAGKLADVFGYSPILTTGRLVFAGGALLGAFAPSTAVLAAARVAMAIGGSLNVPPILAELRNQVAPEHRGRLFGIFGAIMGTAAAIGPLAGDLLIRRFGWHSVFLVNLPLIAFSLVLEPPQRGAAREKKTMTFDVAGSVLFAAAIVMLVWGVQMKNSTGWTLAIAGVATAALFVWFERQAREPLLNPALFAIRSFTAGSSIVALQNFSMYATLFLVPFLIARASGGHSAGAFLLGMTGAMVVASPIGGRISDAIGSRATTLFGSLLATAGALILFSVARGNPLLLVIALALMGAGIGFATSPSQAAALSAVPREEAGSAAGALSTMRYIGGVLGSGVVAIIVGANTTSSTLVWIFPIALAASAVFATLLPSRQRS